MSQNTVDLRNRRRRSPCTAFSAPGSLYTFIHLRGKKAKKLSNRKLFSLVPTLHRVSGRVRRTTVHAATRRLLRDYCYFRYRFSSLFFFLLFCFTIYTIKLFGNSDNIFIRWIFALRFGICPPPPLSLLPHSASESSNRNNTNVLSAKQMNYG